MDQRQTTFNMNSHARSLRLLQSVARRASSTTPYVLLADAISRLDMRRAASPKVSAQALTEPLPMLTYSWRWREPMTYGAYAPLPRTCARTGMSNSGWLRGDPMQKSTPFR